MFKSLKLYTDLTIRLEDVISSLIAFGYKRHDAVSVEGEFSIRGGIIDIFPLSFDLPIRLDLDNEKIQSIKSFNYATGELLWPHRIAIILPLSSENTQRMKRANISEDLPLNNFVDIDTGDYVVHNQYGIGRFLGIDRIKLGDKYKDQLVIEYDNQEKLYVPVENTHLVQKYLAFQSKRPKLYRLGSKDWLREKKKAFKGIQKLAWELLNLQAMRQSLGGFAHLPDTEWQKDFEKTFPYKETPDQIKAVAQVKLDMEKALPMDRLLCGDVGYGKTEIAMRAAFKAVMSGKQVAYLVPTTILAEQHYQNFKKRLVNFPVNLEMLCRFQTVLEQKNIIEALKRGAVDIVIGTHRLLSADVGFHDLGLVIIDEEQRFGVRAKEKLKSFRLAADVLTLTATPIPRTLYMGLMAAKDMSLVNTPPENRLPIKTIVVEYDEDLIVQAILKEAERGGQVFFLHNRVEDIEKVHEKLSRILPQNIRLAYAHGRMHPKVLEKVMSDFLELRVDCLISTMIIESGIDIPNANTIIVNNAHMFGLSDLHQLRGRVGRFNRKAYAYFMIPKRGILDSVAKKRLDALSEHSRLGSGFNIAMEDLEIRGAGNLLGSQQHGFIASIGFDLYCRLLREAVVNFREVFRDEKK